MTAPDPERRRQPADPEGSRPETDPLDLLTRATEAVRRDERSEVARPPSTDWRVAALEEELRKLTLILDTARLLNKLDHTEALLERILEAALELSRMDRVYLLEKEGDGTLSVRASRSRSGGSGQDGLFVDISHTIVDRAAEPPLVDSPLRSGPGTFR